MACPRLLFGVGTYCQLHHSERNSVKYDAKSDVFDSRNCVSKCVQNDGYFVSATMWKSGNQGAHRNWIVFLIFATIHFYGSNCSKACNKSLNNIVALYELVIISLHIDIEHFTTRWFVIRLLYIYIINMIHYLYKISLRRIVILSRFARDLLNPAIMQHIKQHIKSNCYSHKPSKETVSSGPTALARGQILDNLDYRQHLSYKTHYSRHGNCWSLRYSWSIACRRCSNYIFILRLTRGFNILLKDNCKSRRQNI